VGLGFPLGCDQRHGAYEDFDIVLAAPKAFLLSYAVQAKILPMLAYHESIRQHISLFAEHAAAD